MYIDREFVQMSTILDPREIEQYAVEHFVLSEKELSLIQIRAMFKPGAGLTAEHALQSGYAYTRLTENGSIWMSDTPMECRTNRHFLRRAHGDILIFGLGIGLVIIPLLPCEHVRSITVVERNPYVRALIEDQLKRRDERGVLSVVEADAWLYHESIPKGRKFDAIYFDIWPDMDPYIYPQSVTLHRRYRRFLNKHNPNAFMDSWVREVMKQRWREYARDLSEEEKLEAYEVPVL